MNEPERCYHKLIGRRIKNARKDAGLTQDDLAQYLGLNRTAITNKERSVRDKKLEKFMRVGFHQNHHNS
ncbi:MAG: helix-turn-helix transcriptional regulator [Cyanobacteria bacterium J06638_22]